MNKYVKYSLIAVAALVALGILVLSVLFYGFGIDPFDRSGWEDRDDGNRYYLDYHGEPMVNWQMIDNSWYYLDPDKGGAMRTGWLELSEGKYYLGQNGVRCSGWLVLEDGTYYLSPSGGLMVSGWLDLDGFRYYLDADGRKMTGWVELEHRYYLNEQGQMQTGWVTWENNRYYLDDQGRMLTGWVEFPEGTCYMDPESGILQTGWLETEAGRCYLNQDGFLAIGWTDTDEGKFYFDENGIAVTGWLDAEEGRYYLGEDGHMCLGWQEIEGVTYYFREDGTMAVGRITLDGVNYHFDRRGAYVLLVNKWNPVPEGYEPELKTYKGWSMDADCYDALVEMLTDLQNAVSYYKITSVYRTEKTQQKIWNNRYNEYINSGYSKEKAEELVAQSVAVPGTSEHHLGLAIDITGDNAKKWLAENCWKYGFIVRYPEGKTEVTGIIHEPWHYRYVGVELAMELKESGLCLEEYMEQLTKE